MLSMKVPMAITSSNSLSLPKPSSPTSIAGERPPSPSLAGHGALHCGCALRCPVRAVTLRVSWVWFGAQPFSACPSCAIPAWRGLPHRGFLLVFGQRVPLGRFPQDQHQRHVCSGPGRRRSAFPVAPPTFPERHTGEREPGRCPTRRLAHADPLFVWHMAVKIGRRLGH